MMERLSSTSHLLKVHLDPTKVSKTLPKQRLSFTAVEGDEDDMVSPTLTATTTSTPLSRAECSEEDAFLNFSYDGDPYSSSSSSSSSSSLHSFSLQKGERVLFSSLSCRLIEPLRVTCGRLDLSNLHVFFYPLKEDDDEIPLRSDGAPTSSGGSMKATTTDQSKSPSKKAAESAKRKRMGNRRWPLMNVSSFHRRRHLLCNNALEFFFSRAVDDQSTAFIVFGGGMQERSIVLTHLFKLPLLREVTSKLSNSISVTDLWCRRSISNFEYLMHLNTLSGRSFLDLSQYPVFPWILSDYTSESLSFDANNPHQTFRDLSKPMGVINPIRARQFLQRYKHFDEELAGGM